MLCVNGCSVRILVLTHGSETQLQAIQTQRENSATLLPQRCIAVAAQVSNSEVIHHHQDKIGLAALLKSHTAHLQEQQQRAGQPRRLHVVRTKALGGDITANICGVYRHGRFSYSCQTASTYPVASSHSLLMLVRVD